MRPAFRQSMAWLHTWGTLLPGWVLYFMFLTGTTGYFASEIDRWMRPELPLTHAIEPAAAIALGLERLQSAAPNASDWTIVPPGRDTQPNLRLYWQPRPSKEDVVSIEVTGDDGIEDIKPRQTGGGHDLYRLHWELHYLPFQTAYWIVGICAMSLLLALISGVIAHRRLFKELFTFRPGRGARSWLDAHNVLGVFALPFYLMIAYTGLVLLMSVYLPQLMQETARFDRHEAYLFNRAFNQLDARDPDEFRVRRAGVKAPMIDIASLATQTGRGGELLAISVLNPGDANARIIVFRKPNTPLSRREQFVFNGVTGELLYAGAAPYRSAQINQVLTGLHEAVYAGPLLRWLYFFSGLMGAGTIATGLILWTMKRRGKHREAHAEWGLSLVERLNAGVIAGLPVAIAAYFWANRLIPVDLSDRAEWELHTLFATWALVWLYAATRPLLRSWFELLCLAAAGYGLLPVLNALTTDRHLWATLSHDHWRGDWGLAGFDLTVLGLGLMFAGLAWRVRRRVEAAALQPLPAASFANLQEAAE